MSTPVVNCKGMGWKEPDPPRRRSGDGDPWVVCETCGGMVYWAGACWVYHYDHGWFCSDACAEAKR